MRVEGWGLLLELKVTLTVWKHAYSLVAKLSKRGYSKNITKAPMQGLVA